MLSSCFHLAGAHPPSWVQLCHFLIREASRSPLGPEMGHGTSAIGLTQGGAGMTELCVCLSHKTVGSMDIEVWLPRAWGDLEQWELLSLISLRNLGVGGAM